MDEVVHLELFISIFNALRMERPELFTPELLEKCRELMRCAVNVEVAWGEHTIEKDVLGQSPIIVRDFVRFTADQRLVALGLAPIWGTPNPAPWFDAFSDPNGSEENNFETKITTYSKTPVSWDD